MKRFRQILMILTLAAVGLLTVLAIVGAFLGVDRAQRLFNSLPLAIYWSVLAILLIVGVLAFKSFRRQPDLGLLHVGCVLIIGGAMWGSQRFQAEILKNPAPPRGAMRLLPGRGSDTLVAESSLYRLPFALWLEDSYVEYYPASTDRWGFHVVLDGESPDKDQAHRPFDPYGAGRAAIPLTDVEMEVLDYVPMDDSLPAPALLISTNEHTDIVLFKMDEPVSSRLLSFQLVVKQVYRNFQVVGEPDNLQAIDAPGPDVNPALEVQVVEDGQPGESTLVFPPAETLRLGHRLDRNVVLMYLPPQPPRHGLLAPPAVKLRLSRGEQVVVGWLVGKEFSRFERLSLESLYDSPAQWTQAHSPTLILERPAQAVRDYKAEVTVQHPSFAGPAHTLEVNHPLHFGGYHFYLSEFDADGGVKILAVRDAGLTAVWAGFALLLIGLIWRMWVRPLLHHSRGTSRERERAERDAAD